MDKSIILDAVVPKVKRQEGRVGLEQDSEEACTISRESIAVQWVDKKTITTFSYVCMYVCMHELCMSGVYVYTVWNFFVP